LLLDELLHEGGDYEVGLGSSLSGVGLSWCLDSLS